MTEKEQFDIVKARLLADIPDAKPGQHVAFTTSADDLVRAQMRYMKTCISCGSPIQPCCGH